MYGKKVLLALIAVTLFLGVTTSSVSAVADTWPDCGEKTVTVYTDLDHKNLEVIKIDNNPSNPDTETKVINESHNGWKMYSVTYKVPGSKDRIDTFPNGTTSTTKIVPAPGGQITIIIELEKDCDYTPQCKPTSTTVYTLLGNYPCNLLTVEKPIPARFRNPEYIADLCALPNLQFEWNGMWVKNTVVTCDGYETGGQHYDTRFEPLD